MVLFEGSVITTRNNGAPVRRPLPYSTKRWETTVVTPSRIVTP